VASLEYLLTLGIVVAAFVSLSLLLMRALIAATEIETLLFSLPVG
jgi:hypothetical protein